MNSLIGITVEDLNRLVSSSVRREVDRLLHELQPQSTLSEREAAKYIGMQPNTLRQWRSLSKGPAYHKEGRSVRYNRKDLDAWLDSTRTFTAEAPDAPYR